ncbi:SDR family oxidoreductase [Nocardia sp. alder85J]|uniref:SDR family oxidoreductase n=1 Tax=Nocardia sp. alder85J TaxID=2862949 RepID=UPI002251035B|nr:SDR family oxidoreductase [Nocardia sp. alder85J]MCX4095767.1 SDR family oxidoreductase [Nocardia sp. alder85J]
MTISPTDTTTAAAELIARYSARWPIEVAFFDAKHVTCAGEARNRTRLAVERTVPFGMLTQIPVILWYHLAGHSPAVVAEHRTRARWYTTKTHPSYPGMLTKLREIASVVALLASGATSCITGQVVVVDGGAGVGRVLHDL